MIQGTLRTVLSSCILAAALPALGASHARHTSALKRTPAKPKILATRSIDDGRATQIQSALIQFGYLTGEPSGHWDPQTEAAMQKLQADNGWQTKLVPDSRGLIKLGLGPVGDHVTAPADSAQSPTPLASR